MNSILADTAVFGFLGTTEWLIIGGIALLLFGSTKLPKLARSLGQSVVEFKRGIKHEDEDKDALEGGDGTKKLPKDEA